MPLKKSQASGPEADTLILGLEQFIGEGFKAFIDAEQAWGHMADGEAFDNYLRSLPTERLQDVISHLEVYEEQFAPEHVVPGSVVLLNLLSELSGRERGMYALDPCQTVRRVVYRLVRLLKEPDAIETAVRSILSQLTKLSAKRELITMVGYDKNAGHKLVSESAARQLEEDWGGEVRSATMDSLAAEDDLLWTLSRLKRDPGSGEPPFEVPDSPSVTHALLRSAHTVIQSQSLESHAVHMSPRLQWDEPFYPKDPLPDRIFLPYGHTASPWMATSRAIARCGAWE